MNAKQDEYIEREKMFHIKSTPGKKVNDPHKLTHVDIYFNKNLSILCSMKNNIVEKTKTQKIFEHPNSILSLCVDTQIVFVFSSLFAVDKFVLL